MTFEGSIGSCQLLERLAGQVFCFCVLIKDFLVLRPFTILCVPVNYMAELT